MRDCPNGEIRDQLPELVHERLTAAARAAVVAHLADCEACTAEVDLLRRLRGALRDVPAVDLHAIVAALPPAPAAQPTLAGDPRVLPFRRRQWTGWRAAAAAVAVIGGLSVAVSNVDRGTRADSSPSASAPTQVGSDAAAARSSSAVAAPASARLAQVEAGVAEASLGAGLDDATTGELEALLRELESLDATTPSEPEPIAGEPVAGVS